MALLGFLSILLRSVAHFYRYKCVGTCRDSRSDFLCRSAPAGQHCLQPVTLNANARCPLREYRRKEHRTPYQRAGTRRSESHLVVITTCRNSAPQSLSLDSAKKPHKAVKIALGSRKPLPKVQQFIGVVTGKKNTSVSPCTMSSRR